jgi:hypothetical protein
MSSQNGSCSEGAVDSNCILNWSKHVQTGCLLEMIGIWSDIGPNHWPTKNPSQ